MADTVVAGVTRVISIGVGHATGPKGARLYG
jgi:hypothetical protein